MQNIRVKFVVDIVTLLLICITFVIAIDDMRLNTGDNIYALRGCFMFSATLVAEGLGYYVTLGGLRKRLFVLNILMFVIEFAAIIIMSALMFINPVLGDGWKAAITLLLMIYPLKQMSICVGDIHSLYKLYQ